MDGGPDFPIDPALIQMMLDSLKTSGLYNGSAGDAEDDDDADSAAYRAQDMIFDAWEEPDPKKQTAIARKALKLWPLCADAFCLLGRNAMTYGQALGYYRQAVEAGAEAVGERSLREDVGDFWGLLETRPYMRALHELGLAQFETGDWAGAARQWREMLRLNPNDNQGARYLLIDALLCLDLFDEARDLLDRYERDHYAGWPWSSALMLFRTQGDTPAAREALEDARRANPFVADLLLARAEPQDDGYGYWSPGDEHEAFSYAKYARTTWRRAPEALQWLRRAILPTYTAPAPKTPGTSRTTPPPTLPPDADADQIDDATLALLLYGLHAGRRAWKTFDQTALDRLHARGLISDPNSKAKSVAFSEEGMARAEAVFGKMFGKRG